ncbi:MAG TPA: hypothetical protein VIM41_09135, partial [Gammaproteobacteria bacterium]
SEIARLEKNFFPDTDPDVLTHTIATYQRLGCWTSHAEITREAYENLPDVFLYSGIISKRHDYHLCVVTPPDVTGLCANKPLQSHPRDSGRTKD